MFLGFQMWLFDSKFLYIEKHCSTSMKENNMYIKNTTSSFFVSSGISSISTLLFKILKFFTQFLNRNFCLKRYFLPFIIHKNYIVLECSKVQYNLKICYNKQKI